MAKKDTAKDSIGETIKTVAYALLIAGVFRTLFFQPFWIPSGSMKDTLLVGDFLFVNKLAYGYSQYSCPFSACPIPDRIFGSEPERGDIVVFRHPVNNSDFIKRVVGMPGDRIQMKNAVLHINDTPVGIEAAGEFVEVFEAQGPQKRLPACKGSVGLGADCIKDKYIETLPDGSSHSILDVRVSSADNTPVYTVPEGNYFFMGDNRDNSSDSRFPQSLGGVGFVPAKYLIGRADRVIFSSQGRSMLFFWTWRADRFFKKLQ